MSITGATVISKARAILVDLIETYTWGDDDLVGWLNSGQREIVLLKPNSFASPVVMSLQPGPKQTISGIAFIRVTRNMWDANTPGAAVTPVEQGLLDELYPGWHASSASLVSKNYMFDKRQPQTFYVFPPRPVPAGYVEVVQTPYPTDITIVDNDITGNILMDIYEGALIDYTVYRALSEETGEADLTTADKFYQRFLNALGGKSQAETMSQANRVVVVEG